MHLNPSLDGKGRWFFQFSFNLFQEFTSTLIYLFFSVFLFKSLLSFAWILALVAQTVKCLPTMWESRVRSLGPEDPLQKEMVTHSRTLAWKIPWTEEHGRLQSMGSQRLAHDWLTSLSFFLLCQKYRNIERRRKLIGELIGVKAKGKLRRFSKIGDMQSCFCHFY